MIVTIYKPNGEELLRIDEAEDLKGNKTTGEVYRSIMEVGRLWLRLTLREPMEFPLGSYVEYEGIRYTLYYPYSIVKQHTKELEYQLTFHDEAEELKIVKLKNVSGGTPYRLKFFLTAKPIDFLRVIVDTLNLSGEGWQVGDCIGGSEKTIAFNHEDCYSVLGRVAEEFGTEWHIEGRRVSLGKVSLFKDDPIPMQYGYGNGFRSGVGRRNDGDGQPIGKLYVEGGERNINRSKYGSPTLLLPKSATLEHNGRAYHTDADGMSITCEGNHYPAEDSYDGSGVYPMREGTVTEVIKVEEQGTTYYDIKDTTIPESLNYNDYRIAGERATIVFQTGALAGREFDLEQTEQSLTGYDHTERRIKIVPAEIDGFTMPGGTFVPNVGDKYAIFNISLPDEYLSNASQRLFEEAVKYFEQVSEPTFIFDGEVDPIWARNNWLNVGGKLAVGSHILFSDPQFHPEGSVIRITGVRRYLLEPYRVELTLTNGVHGGSFAHTLGKLEAEAVLAEARDRQSRALSKRGWQEAKESQAMLQKAVEALGEEFGESLSPITLQTMQVLVGSEALQFRFVQGVNNPALKTHNVVWQPVGARLEVEGGVIQHRTLGIDTLTSRHKPNDYLYWSLPRYVTPALTEATTPYYLYAKVQREGNGGAFELSKEPRKFEGDAGYYYLLVGLLSSVRDGSRSFAKMYGFSELTPDGLTTKMVRGDDGESYWDLQSGHFQTKKSFVIGDPEGDHCLAFLNGKLYVKGSYIGIGSDSKLLEKVLAEQYDNAVAKAREMDDNIKVGGRNLLREMAIRRDEVNAVKFYYEHLQPREGDNTYTISFDYFISKDDPATLRRVSFGKTIPSIWDKDVIADGEWHHKAYTFQLPTDPSLYPLSNNWLTDLSKGNGRTAEMVGVREVMLVRGNKEAHYSEAPDDLEARMKAEADEAKQMANEAQQSANTANKAVGNLNTYVDGAFKDGLISEAEAKAIEKYINIVENEKGGLEATYNKLYANEYLQGSAKTNLLNTKISYFGKTDQLISTIRSAISKGKTTIAEKRSVDTKYAEYKDAHKSLQSAIEEANKAIQKRIDELSSERVDNIKVGGRNLIARSKWGNQNYYLYGEAKNSGEQGTPLYMVINHGDFRSDLTYIPVPKGQKELTIQSFSGDGVVVVHYYNADKVFISWVFGFGDWGVRHETPRTLTLPIGTEYIRLGVSHYNTIAKAEWGNKATDWSPAPEDVASDIAKAQEDARTAQERADDTYTKAAMDGIITREEQEAIAREAEVARLANLYADNKKAEAINTAKVYTDGKATKLEQARTKAMEEQSKLIKTQYEAYADGVVSEEEKKRIKEMQKAQKQAQAEYARLQKAQTLIGAIGTGKPLFSDPTFATSDNSVSIYDNTRTPTNTLTRIPREADNPTNSTHQLRYYYAGGNANPEMGGFVKLVFSRPNGVFIAKIIAKFPKGYGIRNYQNVVGNAPTHTWLTSNAGTGKYETYYYALECGSEGVFKAFGYFAFYRDRDTPKGPQTVDIAFFQIYDITDFYNASKELQDAITTTQQSITNLQNEVNTTLRDGIIDEAERKSLQGQIDLLLNEREQIIASYNKVYANSQLAGTPKSNLLNAKISYFGAVNNLIDKLKALMTKAGAITKQDRNEVTAQFSSVRDALTTLQIRLDEATEYLRKVVEGKAQSAQQKADTAQQKAQSAQQKADTLKTELTRVLSNVNTVIKALEQADEAIRAGLVKDFGNLQYLVDAFRKGGAGSFGLLLTRAILLSGKDDKVNSIISGDTSTKAFRAGIKHGPDGTDTQDELLALYHDGRAKFGNMFVQQEQEQEQDEQEKQAYIAFKDSIREAEYLRIGGTTKEESELVSSSSYTEEQPIGDMQASSTGEVTIYAFMSAENLRRVRYKGTLITNAEAEFPNRAGATNSVNITAQVELRVYNGRTTSTGIKHKVTSSQIEASAEVERPVKIIDSGGTQGRQHSPYIGIDIGRDSKLHDRKSISFDLTLPERYVSKYNLVQLIIVSKVNKSGEAFATATTTNVMRYLPIDKRRPWIQIAKEKTAFFFGRTKYILMNYFNDWVMKIVGNVLINGNLQIQGQLTADNVVTNGFYSAGQINEYGNKSAIVGRNVKTEKIHTGRYKITHNIGHTDYAIMAIPVNNSDWNAFIIKGTETAYSVEIGVQWNGGWRNGGIHFVIYAKQT